MTREHLSFEYTGPKDLSRLVPDDELDEGGVLQRLQKILKGVSIMPLHVEEYDSTHPPPAVSFFLCIPSCFSAFVVVYFVFFD